MAEPSSARLLATRLAGVLHGFLAGRVDATKVAAELRRIATWVEAGQQEKPKVERPTQDPRIMRIFEHWQERTARPVAKLTSDRRAKILARLAEGYTEEDIRAAITNVASSEFHQGANEGGKRYDDITLICRSGAKLEGYRDMARGGAAPDEHNDETEAKLAAAEALTRGDYDGYRQANRSNQR